MLAIQEVKEAVTRIAEKFNVYTISVTRNAQLSVDVQLDRRPDNTVSLHRMEDKIRSIKGVTINDIFYRDGNYRKESL